MNVTRIANRISSRRQKITSKSIWTKTCTQIPPSRALVKDLTKTKYFDPKKSWGNDTSYSSLPYFIGYGGKKYIRVFSQKFMVLSKWLYNSKTPGQSHFLAFISPEIFMTNLRNSDFQKPSFVFHYISCTRFCMNFRSLKSSFFDSDRRIPKSVKESDTKT